VTLCFLDRGLEAGPPGVVGMLRTFGLLAVSLFASRLVSSSGALVIANKSGLRFPVERAVRVLRLRVGEGGFVAGRGAW
jgi:hypothetical protein